MYKNILAAAILATMCAAAHAGTIVSATGAAINSGGPGFGNIADTYNQRGLSATYVSGVTDFDAYLAGNPTHSITYSGFEWFSASGRSTATVTYDLGQARRIGALALWNEESNGIGSLNLSYSVNGLDFAALASNLLPTDNPSGEAYRADVFRFGAVDARYIRFDMSSCASPYCAIGEVAFDAVPAAAVPEPASLGLFGLGIAGLAALRRRRG